jgi:hypothetical protein
VRTFLLTLTLIIFTAGVASGQTARRLIGVRAYTGGGKSALGAQPLLGFAMDVHVNRTITAAVDSDLWFRNGRANAGIFLGGLIYRFSPDRPTTPYLRGGLAGYALTDATHGAHFGAGLSHRLTDRLSVHTEGLLMTTANRNLYELRLGVSF